MKFKIFKLLVLLLFAVSIARTLKVGDVLEIIAGGHEALTKQVVVQEDGTIDYPLLLDRSVLDMNIQELMDLITLQLAKLDPNAIVVINTISDYKLRVNVLGQVKKPGLLLVHKGASLQEVLLMSEGWTEYADLKKIKLIRAGESYESAITINLDKFLAEGDLALIPEVKDDDTYVVVTAKKSKSIKVLGEVKSPGFYTAYPDANIFDMIQLAGGQAENADLSKVRYITHIDGKSVDTMIDIRRFWKNFQDADSIPKVREGDMIIIYRKTITWPKFMAYLRDFVTLFTMYLLITSFSGS